MKKISTYLKIIDEFRNGSYPSKIALKFNMTRQNLNNYIKILKKHKVIEQRGYAVWLVDEDKILPFTEHEHKKVNVKKHNSLNENQDKVRGHGYQFKIKYPKRISLEARRNYLDKANISWNKTGASSWSGENINFNHWTVILTPISILGWFPKTKSIYSDSAIECFNEALYRFIQEVIKPMEKVFNVSFKKKTPNGKQGYNIKTTAQHHALIKNDIAKSYRDEKRKLYLYDEDGKLWLITDYSLETDELETVHPQTSVDDNTKVKDMLNSVKETGMTFKDVLLGFDMCKDNINKLIENQEYYAENIKSHVKAIRQLGDGVERLTRRIPPKRKYEKKQMKESLTNWM